LRLMCSRSVGRTRGCSAVAAAAAAAAAADMIMRSGVEKKELVLN
jgi:hypothetical protein